MIRFAGNLYLQLPMELELVSVYIRGFLAVYFRVVFH